jgi:hypothetical protein
MDVQAQIPPGLAAVHNFIWRPQWSNAEILDVNHNLDKKLFGEPGHGEINREEHEWASALQDKISTEIWDSYQEFLFDWPKELEEFIPETY